MNGQNGVAVGWSSFIPNYHPLALVSWIRAKLGGQALPNLLPWYRGFEGRIKAMKKGEKLDLGEEEYSPDDMYLQARIYHISTGNYENNLTVEEYDRAKKLGFIKDHGD